MNRTVRTALLVALIGLAPSMARAGWIIEWRTTPFKTGGEKLDSEALTMEVSKNQARTAQPRSITLIDYDKMQFTIINPQNETFWSGSVDDYVKEMSQNRSKALEDRMGKRGKEGKKKQAATPPPVPTPVPPVITIVNSGETKTIAGHTTTKYTVKSNDELFQELWVAEDLNLSGDLDPKKYITYQQKTTASMLGKSAEGFTAIYRSEDYRKLLEKGFALQTTTYHIAGGFEQIATGIRQSDVPASSFAVPDTYRRVRLLDVFPKAP